MRPPSRPNPWFCEPVRRSRCFASVGFLTLSSCVLSETRKTYRAVFSEPRVVVPVSSSEPGQATAPSAVVAQICTESSTADGPPTEPIAPAVQPPEKSRDGRPVTKKRCREPDSDTVGSAAGTSGRAKATSAHAGHDVADSAPARKKKKKKDGVVKK